MKKRKLAAVLAILLAFSILPVTAFANRPPPTKKEALQAIIDRDDPPNYIVPDGEKVVVNWLWSSRSDKYKDPHNNGLHVAPHPHRTTSVVIPASVQVVDTGAFDCPEIEDWGLSKIKSVTLNYGLQEIGIEAFRRNRVLSSIEIPGSVHTIGRGAFYECGLGTIKFHNGLKEIGFQAFFGISAKTIIIPNGVTYIGNGAFENVRTLTDIYVPPSVKNMELMLGQIYYNGVVRENNRVFPANLTVHGVVGSEAERFARNTEGIKFKAVTDVSIFDIPDPREPKDKSESSVSSSNSKTFDLKRFQTVVKQIVEAEEKGAFYENQLITANNQLSYLLEDLNAGKKPQDIAAVKTAVKELGETAAKFSTAIESGFKTKSYGWYTKPGGDQFYSDDGTKKFKARTDRIASNSKKALQLLG